MLFRGKLVVPSAATAAGAVGASAAAGLLVGSPAARRPRLVLLSRERPAREPVAQRLRAVVELAPPVVVVELPAVER